MQINDANKYYLRNVLLRLVEFLGKVLGRGLAGYLDEGHLFAEASHVARRFARAVVIVSLDQEILKIDQRERERVKQRKREGQKAGGHRDLSSSQGAKETC